MSLSRKGDWQQTFSSRQFWPDDPRDEDFSIIDIAHALSLQARFAGHTFVHYSVAEHSVRAARLAYRIAQGKGLEQSPHQTAQEVFATLLHDATEAYLVDIPRPRKRQEDMAGYREAESRLERAIERWVGLPAGAFGWQVVKQADETMLQTEKRDLLGPAPAPWGPNQGIAVAPLPEHIRPVLPHIAEMAFLRLFVDCCAELQNFRAFPEAWREFMSLHKPPSGLGSMWQVDPTFLKEIEASRIAQLPSPETTLID